MANYTGKQLSAATDKILGLFCPIQLDSQRQGIDKHAYSISNLHIAATAGNSSHGHLLLTGIPSHCQEGSCQIDCRW